MKVVDESGVVDGEAMGPDEMDAQGQAIVPTTMQALSSADLVTQVDIAKRYPRNIRKFMAELRHLVTANQDIAASCFYVLKRKDRRSGEIKRIEGRSIRFAEIAAGCYQNIRYGARGIDVGEKFVTVYGIGIDLERNVGAEAPVSRRITTSTGQRYGEDMIGVTIAAATSISIRNVLLRLITNAYTDEAYQAAKQVAIGDAKSLADRRQKVIERFGQMGVTVEEILAYADRPSVDFINLEDLEDLIGLGTAIKEGTQTIDEAFGRGKKPTDLTEGKQSFGFGKKAGGDSKPPAEAGSGAPKTDSPEPPLAGPVPPPPTGNNRAASFATARAELLAEIDGMEDRRRMPAKDRSALWRQYCGTATREAASETDLEKLRAHLRLLVGSQPSLT